MKIIVFGATGKIGDVVWRKIDEAKYFVSVFGRSVENKFSEIDDITKITGDVLDEESVVEAIENHDAVVVCLGPVGAKDNVTLTKGSENIIKGMEKNNVKRIIFVSAVGVGESWSKIPWYSKILFSTVLKNILEEHKKQEELFEKSKLNWTAVRSAVQMNRKKKKGFVASNSANTKTITRIDLAEFIVYCLENDKYDGKAIAVTSLQGKKWWKKIFKVDL